MSKINKILIIAGAIIYPALLIGSTVLLSKCSGTQKNVRIDEEKNKALEDLVSMEYIKALMKANQYSKAREAFCLTQQAVKKSDQNLCEKIINVNNTSEIMRICHKFAKDPQQMTIPFKTCKDLFFRRK